MHLHPASSARSARKPDLKRSAEIGPGSSPGEAAVIARLIPPVIPSGTRPAIRDRATSAPAVRQGRAADRASGSSGSPSLVPSKIPAASAGHPHRTQPSRRSCRHPGVQVAGPSPATPAVTTSASRAGRR